MLRRMKLHICWMLFMGFAIRSIIPISNTIASEKYETKSFSKTDNIDFAVGILDAGELKHTVYNNGQLATFALMEYLVLEFPSGRYKGYGYVAGFDIWVGIPDGSWNPPGIKGPTVSESTIDYVTENWDWGPYIGSLGWLHSGDVVAGDLGIESRFSDLPIMATSTIPESWPEGYFDESGTFFPTPGQHHWPGPWATDPETGLEIEGSFTADKEVIFRITDEEYADRDDLLDQGFPIGVQMDFSVLSFDESYAEDILFFLADLINISPHDYRGVYLGLYFDADVEDQDSVGIINDDEDWMKFLARDYDEEAEDSIDYDVAYIYDYRPAPNWRAHTGVTMLGTPDDSSGRELGLTDWHWFTWFTRPGVVIPSRKELIQYKILSGDTTDLFPEEEAVYFHSDLEGKLDPHFDAWEMIPAVYPDGLDCVFLMSTGPFHLAAGDTAHVAFSLLMGDDEEDLLLNAKTAHAMYEFGFTSQDVTVRSPNGNVELAGVIEIKWEAKSITSHPIELVNLWYRANDGATWQPISSEEENDGTYYWNTETVSDGTRYLIKVSGTDGYLPGEDRSDGTFTINNPRQAIPEVQVISPNGGETIRRTFEIEWWAQDADGDPLTIDIFYSPSNGLYWEHVVLGEENDGHYLWDTRKSGSGDRAVIKIIASDGDTIGEDRSDWDFALLNQRPEIGTAHISGHGNGEVRILVIDSTDFTGHTYQLSFEDSGAQKIYHIYDETVGQMVLQDQSDMSGNVESPQFDGLRVVVRDWPSIEVIDSLTGWTHGDCNWDFDVQAYEAYPADYEIRFTAEGDTSLINPMYVPFKVYNLTEQQSVDFLLQDTDGSGDWSSGDVITFTEPFPVYTWRVTLNVSTNTDTINPKPGDVLTIKVSKPFTSEDIFIFTSFTTATFEDVQEYVSPTNFTLFQNYPNPFNPNTDIRYQISDVRSPIHTTLKIYNILGQKVRTLVDEMKKPGYYAVTWDGKDIYGQEVASGIYFYRLSVNNGQWSETKSMTLVK